MLSFCSRRWLLAVGFWAAIPNGARAAPLLLSATADGAKLLLGVLLLGVAVPAGIAALTRLGLRRWFPHYTAPLLPMLAGACVVSWLGPGRVLYLVPSAVWFWLVQVLWPVFGACLGWRLARRPR